MTQQDYLHLPYRPCVGLMLANEEGAVFVGQRLDRNQDAWQMPQGGIDEGETPRDAALRELEEEIGISPRMVTIEAELDAWLHYDLPAELIPKLWGGRYRGQMQKWFQLRFHGSDSDINIATKHPEFSEWKWIQPGELLDAIVPFKRGVYEDVLNRLGTNL